MIPSQDEIRHAIDTAWRVARGDAPAIERFDLSVDGFFKSFFVIVLAIPFYLILLADRQDLAGIEASWSALVAVEIVGYLARWLSFPLIAALVTRFLGLGQRYVHLIVATNWVALLVFVFLAGVLGLTTILPRPLASVLVLGSTIVVIAVQWFVVRHALRCTAGVATALVLLDLLIGTLVDHGLDRALAGMA